jgi:hypothetical protein
MRSKIMARKRNPMARDLLTNPLYRLKRTKSRFEREVQRDRWSRGGKHKGAKKSFEPGVGSGDFLYLAGFDVGQRRMSAYKKVLYERLFLII